MEVEPLQLAYIGPSLALIGGIVGSVIGILKAGAAGVATLGEDPGQFRNVIVLAALPMTQTFYGFIFFFMVLSKLTALAGIEAFRAMLYLGLGTFVGLAELFSAAYQGRVCATGISLLPRTKGGVFLSTMILAVYVELFGILGMVFGLLGILLWG